MANAERYQLRPLQEKDASSMLEWMHDDRITKYLRIGGQDYSLEDALGFIESAKDETCSLHRAIVDENDAYQGTVSLKNINLDKKEAEYAIALQPKAQGSGAAYSATNGILRIAFEELELGRVYLNVLEENRRAVRFYEKFGFQFEKKTTLSIDGEEKALLWYEVKNAEIISKQPMGRKEKKKIVFFFQKKQYIGGSFVFLLMLARSISARDYYDVYYVNYRNAQMDKLLENSHVHFCEIETIDFSEFEGADFVVPFNYLLLLLEKVHNLHHGRVLLYCWHPNIVGLFANQFYYRNRDIPSMIRFFDEKNALSFMDLGSYCALRSWHDIDSSAPTYIPVFPSEEQKAYVPLKRVSPNRLSIGWLGRLDSDKIYALINLLENLKQMPTDMPIDVHIIGDGDARNMIALQKYAPKIRFIFTSYLLGDVRNEYIRSNVDLMVTMGISALDTANLSVPVVISTLSSCPYHDDKYVFLFDVREGSLGWDTRDIDRMGVKTHTLEEVVERVYADGGKEELGAQCRAFACENFSLEKSTELLLEAVEKCELNFSDCWANPQISRQMRQYDVYKKVRKNRGYEEYILFIQKLNRLQNKGKLGKAMGIADIVTSAARKACKGLMKKVGNGVNEHRKRVTALKRYHQVQAGYPAKIEAIRQIYQEQKKLKAIFLVIFSSVFPTEPVFRRMLQDDRFDPYIMVTPDMERSAQHGREVYDATYRELSKKYGDRVLQGYDFKLQIGVEPGEEYQLAFFNNPYFHMAHEFHHVTYFLDKSVLTFYVNYGFAAVKYGRTIMKTDFYNMLWKACLDSEINYLDVKKHQPIKGSNAVVTGYLKMDTLPQAMVYPRARKRIIISPHHTVLGWKSLDISNFLTYFEFFIDLPKLYPQIDFVFRPHPLLFSNLTENNIWTEREVDAYLTRMQDSPNIRYDASGDYFELFVNSDGMIHDCSSFIGEYLFTEKPCCYMLKSEKEVAEICNPMGVKCIEQYYKAFSQEDIIRFIDDVILKEIDPLKRSREEFVRTELKFNYPHATDTVIQVIEENVFV